MLLSPASIAWRKFQCEKNANKIIYIKHTCLLCDYIDQQKTTIESPWLAQLLKCISFITLQYLLLFSIYVFQLQYNLETFLEKIKHLFPTSICQHAPPCNFCHVNPFAVNYPKIFITIVIRHNIIFVIGKFDVIVIWTTLHGILTLIVMLLLQVFFYKVREGDGLLNTYDFV